MENIANSKSNKPIYIFVENSLEKKIEESLNTKWSKIIGIGQVAFACSILAFEIGMAQSFRYPGSINIILGVISFLTLLICGGLSIGSSKTANVCLVIGTLVLSVISALYAFILFFQFSFLVYYYDSFLMRIYFGSKIGYSLFQVILSIASFVLTCKATCFPEKNDFNRVLYKPDQMEGISYNNNYHPANEDYSLYNSEYQATMEKDQPIDSTYRKFY